MKILNSENTSPFGGIFFVINELDRNNDGKTLNDFLPRFGSQSLYDWRDILYSYWSVFFCGGDSAEDLSGNFKHSLTHSPVLKIPSPDRVLNRLKEIAVPDQHYSTSRGNFLHHFTINETLADLNLTLQNRLFNFSKDKVDLDYDNTICNTKKQDAERTYQKELGYVPGVGLVGSKVVYVENRNERSNAGILQEDTLQRMFIKLKNKGIKVNRIRADCAFYRYKVIRVVESNTDKFYIKARMSAGLAITSIKQCKTNRKKRG